MAGTGDVFASSASMKIYGIYMKRADGSETKIVNLVPNVSGKIFIVQYNYQKEFALAKNTF